MIFCLPLAKFTDLIREIWRLKDNFIICSYGHIRRESKRLADSFDKFGLSVTNGTPLSF